MVTVPWGDVTPTQLIYQAWQVTPKPLLYNTLDKAGEAVVKPVSLLSNEENKHFVSDISGVCALCGTAFDDGGAKTSKVLTDTFTDYDRLKAPASPVLCAACLFCLSTRSEGRVALRTYSHYATPTRLKLCNRKDIHDAILNPGDEPFVLDIAMSQQKHLSFKSVVNYRPEQFMVLLEEEQVSINLAWIREAMPWIEALRGAGLNKTEIETGNYHHNKALSFGLGRLEEVEDKLRQWRKQRQFAVALYVAQIMEEDEARCFLDSQLQTKMRPVPPCSSTQSIAAGTSVEAPAESICGDRSKDLPDPAQSGQIQSVLF